MQRWNDTVFNQFGGVVKGASVKVRNAGLLTSPTIYSDNGTSTVANSTVAADNLGRYSFYAANGRYDLDISGAGITSYTESDVLLFDPNAATGAEWQAGPAPTFVSGTQFTLVGDQTSTFTVGRRLQFTVTAGTVYGRITASVFTTLTTVTIVAEPGQALDSGLSAVNYGILGSTHPSIPWITTQAADTVSTIASAATVNLDSNAKDYAFISGTTTITAITLGQGKECTVEFQGALTLTNGASLILPGGANITTATGDTAIFRGEASGVVRCILFQPARGQMATLAGTETLTNKTLASPTINTPTIVGSGGTLTLPAGPDTLVGRATTDTLTSKTHTNPANTDQTLTAAATLNWDMSLGGIATVTLNQAGHTFAAPTNLKKGTYILHVLQDGTGNRTITTWNSVFKWPSATAPTLSTGANKRDILCFVSDGTNLYGPPAPWLDVR